MVVHTELGETLVDIRALHTDAHLAAFVDEAAELFCVVAVARKHCRHVFGRVVGL